MASSPASTSDDDELPEELRPDPDEDPSPEPARKPRRKVWWIAAILFLAFSSVITARMTGLFERIDTSHRIAHAVRTSVAPVIDGTLEEAVWGRAEPTAAFVRSHNGEAAPLDCRARLLWDEEALYVAFEAQDHDLLATYGQRDEALYTQDVVEVFIDADGDQKSYTELEVSPRGTLFDALFPSYRKNLDRSKRWNLLGFKAQVALRGSLDAGADRGWTAELRIPFASLADTRAPKVGDRWHVNLFRIDVHDLKDPEHGDYTAWNPPLKGDFHTLDRFGTLIFKE